MLWSRSASLISRTRMSPAIATIILRTFSACASSRVWNWSLSSFVRPSTISATSSPNSPRIVSSDDGGVLDGVVQEPGLERGRVQPEIREDQRDRERVLDERFARQPVLPGVRLRRGLVRRLEPLEVALRVVGAHLPLERREPGGLAVGTPATRQGQPPAAPGGAAVRCRRSVHRGYPRLRASVRRSGAPAIRRPISSGSA